MFKLFNRLLIAICTLSIISAQTEDIPESIVLQKTKVAGFNFLSPILGLYSGSIGLYQKNGKVEIKIPLFYWKIPESLVKGLSLYGAGIHYRMYSNEGGAGFFWGPVAKVNLINWDVYAIDYNGDYGDADDDGYAYTGENITGTLFEAGIEIGRRWQWKNGFTVAPTFGYNLGVGEIESSSSGEKADFDAGGLQYSLGLGWAF